MKTKIQQIIDVNESIAEEIVWLNEQGVRTEGSCSGHGKSKPSALILPGSAEQAQELGYSPSYREGLFEIELQGCDQRDIVLRETGQQPYSDCVFSAGLVEGHAFDSVYLKLERDNDPFTIFLRPDEAMAIITLLSGALWSERMTIWELPRGN